MKFQSIVRPNREIVYIDMDDVFVDYKTAWIKAIEANPQIKFPQAVYKFYENLEPLPNAVKCIKLLDEIGYECFIATRPSYLNPLCYTEKRMSVEKHLGIELCQKLIIIPDKTLLKGHFLIDDCVWDGFDGEQILFGSPEFPDWLPVYKYLERRKI